MNSSLNKENNTLLDEWVKVFVIAENLIKGKGSPAQMHRENNFFFFFWPRACGILDPQPGIKPTPAALELKILNHWSARKVLRTLTSTYIGGSGLV